MYSVLRRARRLPFLLHTATSVSSRLSRTVEGRYLGNSVKAAARPASSPLPQPATLILILAFVLALSFSQPPSFSPSILGWHCAPPTPLLHPPSQRLYGGPLVPSVESRGLRDSHFDLGEPYLLEERRGVSRDFPASSSARYCDELRDRSSFSYSEAESRNVKAL